MKPLQFLIQPWRKSAAARVDVRVGDAPSAEGYGIGGFDWEPAVVTRPTFSLELMPLELDGKTQTGKAHFALQLCNVLNVADARMLDYQGAPITIWSTDDLGWDRRVVEFTGNVNTARYDTENNTLTVDAEASTLLIEKPLLTLSYSGAGGLNGETNKRGILRPAGFGIVEYVEPVWFDETYNIGQLDGYGNLISIQRAMEGADERTASFVADYASYTLLKNAIIAKTIPPGRWGTCLADGLVGLGAPPVQGVPWGFNCTFGYGKPGSLMQRIVQFHAGVAIGLIDTVSFAAITAQVEAVLGTTADIGYWTSQQRQVIDLLQAVAGSVNSTPIVTLQGIITVTRGVTSAAVQTLDRSGSVEPRVINWKSADSRSPFYQLKARTARPARVLNRDEVLYTDTLVDMGVWAAGTGYRIGNTVFGSDGAQFLYINGTPTVGPALPTSTYPPAAMATNAYWQQITRPVPTTGSMIGVADNATADLKLTDIGSQTCAIVGNSFTRNAGAADFTAMVRGGAIQGPVFAEVDISPGSNWTIFTLDDDATSFIQGAHLLYFQFHSASGSWAILQNGTTLYSGATATGITGKLRLSYDGIRFRVYLNATQLGQDIAATASNLILWPKWYAYQGAVTYTGLRSGPYTANIWPDISGPGTPANNATAPFILIPLDANVRVTGNELLAVTSTSSSAYISYPATGSAEFSWKADGSSNHNFICGFVIAANVGGVSGSGLAYGLEASGGNLYVWAAGVQTLLSISTAGDRYKITYDGVNFRAYKNGVEITAALKPAVAANTYFGRLGLNGTAGVKLTEVASASFTQNNFSDIGGTTRPADNAGTTVNIYPVGPAPAVATGNSIISTTGGFNSCVRGDAIVGPCFAEMDIVAGSVDHSCQIDTEATGSDYTVQQLHVSYNPSSGAFGVARNGTLLINTTIATGLAGKIRAGYDGVRYRAYVAGSEYAATDPGMIASGPGLTHYPKWPAFTANVRYTGLAAAPFTDNAWSSTGGAGRPADGATTDLVLTSIGSTLATIVGNSIIRSSGGGDYACCVAGPPMIGSAYAEAIVPAGGYAMVSLDNDGTSTAIASMDAMIYCANGDLSFLIGGSSVYSVNPGTVTGQKIGLAYDGVRWRAYLNGVQQGTDQIAAAALRLWPKWHSFTAAVTVTGLRSFAGNSNLWTDIGGAHVPAPDAGTSGVLTAIGSFTTVVGNSSYKTGGTHGLFQGGAVGAALFGTSFISSSIIQPLSSAGYLTTIALDDDATNYTDTTMSYNLAIIPSGSGNYTWYLKIGASVAYSGSGAGLTAVSRIALVYDGVSIYGMVDGSIKGTISGLASGLVFWPKVLDYHNTSPTIGVVDILYGPWSENAWSRVGGPNKPADNATTDLVLTAFGSQAGTIVGNTFNRNAGSSDFNSAVRSTLMNGACLAEMDIVPGQYSIMMVDSSPTTSSAGSQNLYVHYDSGGGNCVIEVNGVVVYSAAIATGITGKLQVIYDRVRFRVFIGGTQRGGDFAAGSSTLQLYVKWFDYSAIKLTGLRATIVPASNLWSDVGGTGTPANNADVTAGQSIDVLVDGATYARVAGSQLSSGVPRLSVAGSGIRLADPRNLPAITAMNLGYKFTGTVSYTSAAGTPATATISVTAGSSLIGTNSISYSALSVGVTGTGGTTVSYYLYVDDPTFAGGAATLVATTTANTVYSNDGRVLIGFVDVIFPASGTGGGSGGGGGGWCVAADAWVEIREPREGENRPYEIVSGLFYMRARWIDEGDMLRVLSADREAVEWAPCEGNSLAPGRAYLIRSEGGVEVTLSESTPITLRDGSVIRVVDVDGHALPVLEANEFRWEACRAQPIGNVEVAHIMVGQRTYAAGDVAGRAILTHNPKP